MNPGTRFHYDHIACEHTKKYGYINLYQIGDLCFDPTMQIDLHKQVCYEITLIVSGRARCITNGREIVLQKGMLHFCKKGDMHAIYTDSVDPLRFFYMGFTVQAPSAHSLWEIVDFLCTHPLPFAMDNYDIFSRFCTIFAEFMGKHAYSDLLVEGELLNILIDTYRSFRQESPVHYSQDLHASNIVHDMILYIDQNIKNIDLLSSLSTTFSYSYNYLSHLFTVAMHQTLKDYVKEKKFALACTWLTDTNMTVTQISDELHFTTIHTFSRAFKNQFGMSPAVYRAQNRKKQDSYTEKGHIPSCE